MKTPQRLPFFLSVLLTLAAPGWALPAQDAAPAAEALPSAREVIDRFAEVTHAKEALEKTRSVHMQGKFSMPAMGIEGAMEIWSGKPDLRLTSIEMGGFGSMLSGFDGQVAWMTNPMMGARILKDAEFLQAKLEASYDSVLKSPDLYESMKTVGRENFEGKDCYKLELVAKPLAGMDAEKTREVRTINEFYEVASGLVAGSKGKQEGEMGGGPYTQIAADYKEFGGQLVATKNTVRASGQEIVLTIDTVEFDTAGETTFALPKEIQALLESEAKKAAAKPQ